MGLSVLAECFWGQMGKLTCGCFAKHPPAASTSRAARINVWVPGRQTWVHLSLLPPADCMQGLCLSKLWILHLKNGGSGSPGGVDERIHIFHPGPGTNADIVPCVRDLEKVVRHLPRLVTNADWYGWGLNPGPHTELTLFIGHCNPLYSDLAGGTCILGPAPKRVSLGARSHGRPFLGQGNPGCQLVPRRVAGVPDWVGQFRKTSPASCPL